MRMIKESTHLIDKSLDGNDSAVMKSSAKKKIIVQLDGVYEITIILIYYVAAK